MQTTSVSNSDVRSFFNRCSRDSNYEIYRYDYEEESYFVEMISNKDSEDGFRTLLELSYKHIEESLSVSDVSQLKEYSPRNAFANNSPEAVAQRIFDFAASLFSSYQKQHSDEDMKEVVSGFAGEVRKGFEQGFKEAVEILKALQALNPGVEESINKTRELFFQKLDDFEETFSNSDIQSISEANPNLVNL